MLDAGGRFEIDDVSVFPDGTDPAGFYAISSLPRVARDGGDPAMSFTVYGRREAGAFVANGGVLSLTTELAVPTDAAVRLTQALTARIAAAWPPDSPDQLPRATLFAAEWLESTVRVALLDGLILDGRPSLGAGNRCSFSLRLDRNQASTLVRAFRAGLPDATVTYTGELRSGGAGSATSTGGHRSSASSSSFNSTTSSGRSTGGMTSGPSGDEAPMRVSRHTESRSTTGGSGGPSPCGSPSDGSVASSGPASTRSVRALIDVTAWLRHSLPDPMAVVTFAEL